MCQNCEISLTPSPLSDVGIYDRVVIQEILKEIAQTQQIDLNAKHRFKGTNYMIFRYYSDVS